MFKQLDYSTTTNNNRSQVESFLKLRGPSKQPDTARNWGAYFCYLLRQALQAHGESQVGQGPKSNLSPAC